MVIFTFFKLWFGMISECWQDAKTIHDKEVQKAFKEFSDVINEEDKR